MITKSPALQYLEEQPVRLSDTEVDELMRMGGLAPSGGNVQPWKVTAGASHLDLRLHPEHAKGFLDVGYGASLLSLGAFLENVCLTAAALGLVQEVEIHEFREVSDLVVRLRTVGRGPAVCSPLYEAIPRRHTNRRFHEGAVLPQSTLDELKQATEEWPRAQLAAVSEASSKRRLARVLGGADVVRTRHSTMFSEMMSEVRWSDEEATRTRDGLALSTLELSAADRLALRALNAWPALRRVVPRGAMENAALAPVMACSHVCLLSLEGDLTPEAMVNAGRAVQRLWLKATSLELSLQPMTALPFMVLRARFHAGAGFTRVEAEEVLRLGSELGELYSLSGDQLPIFVFRLSKTGPASNRALRRPQQTLYAIERDGA
jgi:nitroreductase